MSSHKVKTVSALVVFILCISSSCAAGVAEVVAGHLRERIESAAVTFDRIVCADGVYCRSPFLMDFYVGRHFQPAWTGEDGNILIQAEDFLHVIRDAPSEGLRPVDYHVNELESLRAQIEKGAGRFPDSMALTDFEITMTDALLLYATHLLHGRVEHHTVYPDDEVKARTLGLAEKFYGLLVTGGMKGIPSESVKAHHWYEDLQEKLREYRDIAEKGGWPTIPVGPTLKRGSRDERVVLLRTRLSLTGDLEEESKGGRVDVFDHAVEEGVKRFQRRHGLKADGKVSKETLVMLNVPVEARIRQIALNLDRLRWLPDELGESHVLVNIADFRLDLFEKKHSVLSMKIIVGKKDQPSCMLSGKIAYLELNPFWKIPDSIAVKEILPQIKKNPEYLTEKKIKVLYDWNDMAKEIDPNTVDWSRVREHTFRFKLRQEPGGLNPLGRVKFIFPNECEIYLHDTPGRSLFGRDTRDFSHGCIRIEKPIDLAVYLLGKRENWTRKKVLAEIAKGKRQVIYLKEPFDVHIGYFTAWVDRQGILQFRKDVYRLDDVPFDLPLRTPVQKALGTSGMEDQNARK